MTTWIFYCKKKEILNKEVKKMSNYVSVYSVKFCSLILSEKLYSNK